MISITIPLPPKGLGQNSRGHWRKKAVITKGYRKQAWAAAIQATRGQAPERWAKATVDVKAFYPTLNHPDPINLLDRLKAAFDGLQDAGIIANDKGLYPGKVFIDKDALNPRIELTVTGEL